jgi:site-specific DNA recombinase
VSEVERKSARQKAANAQRAKDEGGPWWPSRPFGYDAAPDRETGKWWTVKRAKGQPPKFNPIWLDPTEAALVRQAYRDFNAGATLRSLAARWNAAGVLTPKGNPWTGTQVRALLMSERNAGLRPCREKGPDGKVKTRLVPGTWDAVVTENVWRMAVRKLSNPKRRSGPSRGRKYLLSGIARCGRKGCGAPLGSAISSRGQRQYHCNRCQKISRDGVKLDQLVTERVVWRLSKPDAVELLESDNDDVDTDALREQRQALEDRLAQLGKDFATARPEFTQAALAHATEQLEAINAVLETPAKARIFEGVIGAKDVRAAFAGLDLGRQRTIVNALMAIRVKPVGKGTGPVFDTSAIELRPKQ